jgi:hypothetical protein
MTKPELLEQVQLEAESMRATLRELSSLLGTTEGREPTTVERAAAGAFLGQLYGGAENILKRFCRQRKVALPEGAQSHRELLALFGEVPHEGLPALFRGEGADEMDEFRRFRHLFVHGYSILLDWPRMLPLAETAGRFFASFLDAALRAAGDEYEPR